MGAGRSQWAQISVRKTAKGIGLNISKEGIILNVNSPEVRTSPRTSQHIHKRFVPESPC